MPEIELIGTPLSIFVRAVRIALIEKGVPYRLNPAIPHSPEVNALNPVGRVPVLRHGDFTLFESKAIATYLDRVCDGPKLFPPDPKQGALVEQWVSLAISTVIPGAYPYLLARRENGVLRADPDKAEIERTLKPLKIYFAALDKGLAETGYLVAGRLTYADIAYLPILSHLADCPESGAAIAALPHLSRVFKGHRERRSFIETIPPPGSGV